MTSGRRFVLAATVALAGILPVACQSAETSRNRLKRSTSVTRLNPVTRNHFEVTAIPTAVRRVAVLPLHGVGWRDSELASLDTVLREAFSRTELFEVIALSRDDLAIRFGTASFDSSGALPANLLSRLQTDFGADAVLLLDLTHFSPYQPVALGVRARLVTVAEGEALWAFDGIFDAAQADVSLAARRFSNGKKRPPAEAEDTTGVLQSPVRFARYVSAAVFESLPPRRTE